MIEYRVVQTKVKEAENVMNELAVEGWQVISTDLIQGNSLTMASTPMIITLVRKV